MANLFTFKITNNMLAGYLSSRVTDLQTHKEDDNSICEFDFIFDHYLYNIPAEKKEDMRGFRLSEHSFNPETINSIELTFVSTDPNKELTEKIQKALHNFCAFIKKVEEDEGRNNAPVEISVQFN